MALEDKIIPYEILIRFNEDGTPQGAHVQYRRRVVLDGEVLKDEPLAAQPLTLDANFPVSGLMTEALESALSEINNLNARLISLELDLEASRNQIAAMEEAAAAPSAAPTPEN